jgi:hypothetical protein
MRLRSVVGLSWALITGAQAQVTVTPTDTVFRAAYCAAVIGTLRREHKVDYDAFKVLCAEWRSRGFQTIEQCAESEWQRADEEFASKEKRFRDYTMLFVSTADDKGLMTQILVVGARGRRDAQATLKATSSQAGEWCVRQCAQAADNASCTYQCLNRMNPTQASIFRCLMLPDDLPF